MPTPTKGPRLGGGPAHERLMLANLATALFEHGKITTTETKAKRLRPLAERLITKAKRGDIHARRTVGKQIHDKTVLHVLFSEIGPRYENRPGGYTRITKIGPRKGDNAPMAVIELVEALTVAQTAVGEAERARSTRTAPRKAVTPAVAESAAELAAESPTAAAVAAEAAGRSADRGRHRGRPSRRRGHAPRRDRPVPTEGDTEAAVRPRRTPRPTRPRQPPTRHRPRATPRPELASNSTHSDATSPPAPRGRAGSFACGSTWPTTAARTTAGACSPACRTVQGVLEAAIATILRLPVGHLPADRRRPHRRRRPRPAPGRARRPATRRSTAERAPTSCAGGSTACCRRDIRIFAVAAAAEGFDARFSALSREYQYRVVAAPADRRPVAPPRHPVVGAAARCLRA